MPQATRRTDAQVIAGATARFKDFEQKFASPSPIQPPVDPRELMSIIHKHINVLSGSMVLAFKDGPKPTDFAAWAEELRTCAEQLDKVKI